MKKLSIITVTWRSKDLIEAYIESIQSNLSGFDYELIIVENNSGDGLVELVRSKYPAVKVLPQDNNAGYAKGMLAGYAVSTGEFVAFMNPDMTITSNIFEVLISKLNHDNKIGLIAPQLRYPDGSLQMTVKRDPKLADQLLILLKLHHLIRTKSLKRYLAKDFDYSTEQSVEQLMGAFLMCKREALEKFNWDADYPLWWEDVQICIDSRKAGFKNIYTPDVFVYHHEGKSFAQVMSLAKQKRFNFGMRQYFKKNSNILSYSIISILSPLSLLLAWVSQTFKIKPRPQSKV